MIIYLASPYTHPDKTVEDQRFQRVCITAGDLIMRGYHIFCPIAMAHPINRAVGMGGKFEYWQEFDFAMLMLCGELWVVTFDGWDHSVGVKSEIEHMTRLGRPVYYIDPQTLEKTERPM